MGTVSRTPANIDEPVPTAIDLFCGAGGLTQGLRDAGFLVVAALDNDELAVESYKMNHGGTRALRADVVGFDPEVLLVGTGLSAGELDLLAGCPPCQGFSTMRTRNGGREASDNRKELIFEFGRFARALRPRALMLENVPALGSDQRMTRLRQDLRTLGYTLRDDVLDVSRYGVPQRRRRFIMLGLLEGAPAFGKEVAARRTVRDAIGGLLPAGRSGDPLHDLPERRSERVAAFIRDIPKDGGSRSDLGKSRQLRCHVDSDGWKDVYGRLSWDKASTTITGGFVNPSKGRFLHPQHDRALTLREGALLQSFGPEYQFSLRRGKFAAAQLIGNALPPQFITQHATSVRESLTASRATPTSGA